MEGKRRGAGSKKSNSSSNSNKSKRSRNICTSGLKEPRGKQTALFPEPHIVLRGQLQHVVAVNALGQHVSFERRPLSADAQKHRCA